MEYLPLIQQIQKEQKENPLHRYKEVREYYAEAMREDCILYFLGAWPDSVRRPSPEPFPKSLFPKFGPRGNQWHLLGNRYYDKILPITIQLAVELCVQYQVTDKNMRKGFEWDHQYTVCLKIKRPVTTLEQLTKIRNSNEWVKITPEWALTESYEL